MLPRNRILFKYRKFDDNTLRIFREQELWFAKPETLNDPFEANDSFPQVLDAVWERYSVPPAMQLKYENKLKSLLRSTGICAFSKARKNQLMWSHYADEHKGICIGFKEAELRPSGSNVFPIDVSYQDEYPFEQIIERINYFDKVPNENTLDNIAGDILYSVLSTKYTSWRYERERRLVHRFSGARKFEPNAINSIAFGLRMKFEDKQDLKELLSDSKWSHIKWYQAIKSSTKYMIEFERIK